MKYAVAATTFLFTLARAQGGLTEVISQIPTCALNCLSQGISGAGCGIDDFECTCGNFEAISGDVQPCLGNSECTTDEVADTLRLAAGLCNSIGSESASVTLTTVTESGSASAASETPSNLETIPVASESLTETLTTTVGSETVTVSASSEASGSVTTTVTEGSATTTATESEASASDSAADASGSDAAATESGSGNDDSAAGRVQAAGWAVAGVVAAAIAL
ncbi:hypothetical protein ACHAQA_009349 [Verticillium albo-atrum]